MCKLCSSKMAHSLSVIQIIFPATYSDITMSSIYFSFCWGASTINCHKTNLHWALSVNILREATRLKLYCMP